jgi:nucleoside-diphosphate-sugar epimerase
MIVGTGLIGKSLNRIDTAGITIFASGVSNSRETDAKEFLREKSLIESHLNGQSDYKFVYISTCSVNDPSQSDSPYVIHKKLMENLVLSHPGTHIVRLPNVVGPDGNLNNLVNHFVKSIRSGEALTLQESARRYILGVDELAKLMEAFVSLLPHSDRVVDFAPPTSTSVLDLVRHIEDILGIEADISMVPGGSSYPIDFSNTAKYSKLSEIEFLDGYVESVLKKWITNKG